MALDRLAAMAIECRNFRHASRIQQSFDVALTDGHVILPQVLKSADEKVLWASGTQCEDELDEWERGHVELALEGPPPQPEPPPLFYVLRNILQSASYMAVCFSSICYQFRSASP